MAVEFLSDQQAAQYAAFNGAPSRAELERYFSWMTRIWRKCTPSGVRTTGSWFESVSPEQGVQLSGVDDVGP